MAAQVATTAIKQKKFTKLNAKQLREHISSKPEDIDREMSSIMADVKGTSGWMGRQKTDVKVMFQKLGNPTWYVQN